MDASIGPIQGLTQPRTGADSSIPFSEMKRQSKSQRPSAVIRGILAQNLTALRDKKFSDLPNATKRNEALAAMCRPTSKSQIQRITASQLGTSIDVLELLAAALDVRPQDLLTPYFASLQNHKAIPDPASDDALQRKPGRLASIPRRR